MTIKTFTQRLLREQPVRFSLAVITLALVGVFEGAGVATIVPLLDLLGGSQSTGTVGKVVSSVFGFFHLPVTLVTVLGAGLFFIIAQQVLTLAQNKIVWGSIYRFEKSLRDRLYENVFSAGWPFFVKEKTSDLSNALVMEASRAAMAYSYMNQMLGAIIVIAVYIVLAFVLSWQMTVLVAVVGVILIFVLRKRVSRGTKYGEGVTRANAALQQQALENIAGAKLVKGCAIEDETVERFERETDALASVQYKSQMNTAWLRAFYDTISISVVFVGIYVATQRFHMSIASLVVFLFVFYRVSPRLSNVQLLQHSVLSQLPAVNRIDALTAAAQELAERTGGERLGAFSDAIRLSHVTFAYGDGEPVVRDLTLSIPCGRTVAIVGPSGAGKTTVMDMVMALLTPTDGDLTVDGVRLDRVELRDWRRRISYVPQDAVMFHATVRENLMWGSPDATVEEAETAARLAFAHDFIAELPDGYDTIVGDRGMRLSGGQRQRLALARALVRRPEVLILDEATSALDAESEQRIQEAIEHISGEITVLIVTHRLATVRHADLIYVLEGGALVDSGTWDELTAREGRFLDLKRLQELESVKGRA